MSSARQILDGLLRLGGGSRWYKVLRDNGTSHKDGPRVAIFLGNLLPALNALLHSAPEFIQRFVPGLRSAYQDAIELVKPRGKTLSVHELEENPEYSPHLFLNLTEAMHVDAGIAKQAHRQIPEDGQALLLLKRIFEREVDRQLARSSAHDRFDPAALAFALRGLTLLDPPVRDTAICHAAVRAVAASQNPDGTWPDGASALLRDTSANVQQPSIKTALCLAEVCLTKEGLVAFDRKEQTENVLPTLHVTARYLARTLVRAQSTSGWVSDRVRWPNISETWITALCVRFWFSFWALTVTQRRAETLTRFDASHVPRTDVRSINTRLKRWEDEIVEPDQVARPCNLIRAKLLTHCIAKQREGRWLVRPNVSSFLVYGPPGSGKTFFIAETAAALGWPLLALNPGHFIEHGLKMIEAQARTVFDALIELDHAVVLFDECDQLFFDRDAESCGSGRGILSFLTASMLPKLQQLNEVGRVVFIVATNYLANIDPAIRRPGRVDRIILFDRPDEAACMLHLRRVWGTRRARNGWSAPRGWQARRIAKQCAGLTVKEIRTYAAEVVDTAATPPPLGTREEYVRWCTERGPEELDADTTLDASQRKQIERRWKAVQRRVESLKA